MLTLLQQEAKMATNHVLLTKSAWNSLSTALILQKINWVKAESTHYFRNLFFFYIEKKNDKNNKAKSIKSTAWIA